MIPRRPRSTPLYSSAASDVYKRQEGEITVTGRIPPDPPDLPLGEVRQRPPVYSAVKIEGERAYRRARRGEHVEMPERVVSVHRFEQLWRSVADAPGAAGQPQA